jgi:hypothetical protein
MSDGSNSLSDVGQNSGVNNSPKASEFENNMSTSGVSSSERNDLDEISESDQTSLARGEFWRTRILNRLVRLIIEYLETLQHVAVVQSERLTLFAQWQKAYTDVMSQIIVFTKDDKRGMDPEDSETRNQWNQRNMSYTETLRNYRSVVGDDAKAFQPNVNLSNDGVNKNANLATTILQEMMAVINSIFK